MSLESDGGMILTGENRRTRRKTCPSATFYTTNPTWIDPGANPVLRGERPATKDLNHGTALMPVYFTVDVEVSSSLEINLAVRSLSLYILAGISRQNSYLTARSSGFRAWTKWSLYGSVSKRLWNFGYGFFVATAVHDPRVTLFLWTSVQENRTRSTVALHTDIWPGILTFDFTNAHFMLNISCTVSYVIGFSAGSFHVKWYAKCTFLI
jgi:hypothetical protein